MNLSGLPQDVLVTRPHILFLIYLILKPVGPPHFGRPVFICGVDLWRRNSSPLAHYPARTAHLAWCRPANLARFLARRGPSFVGTLALPTRCPAGTGLISSPHGPPNPNWPAGKGPQRAFLVAIHRRRNALPPPCVASAVGPTAPLQALGFLDGLRSPAGPAGGSWSSGSGGFSLGQAAAGAPSEV
jgi:hypothetical protein